MDIFLEDEHHDLRRQIHSWLKAESISGVDGRGDLEKDACRLVQQFGQAGYLLYIAPRRFGGVREEVQARDLCVIREELARSSALADVMFGVQALGSYPIVLAGSDDQKSRYLPPFTKGETIAAFALTEPDAGSDVSAIATAAVKKGDGYLLNGVKHFISNAGIAHTYVVFASTDPGQKASGLSAFIVEANTPGLLVKEKTALLSPHPIGVLAFEDCFVSQSQCLGREGQGAGIAFRTLDTLRATVGAAALGFAKRALEEATRYSKTRRQFGRPLAEFQVTQFKLAEMAMELEAARLLVYQAAWLHDRHEPELPVKSSMAKLFATEAAQRIVDQAVQIHGGNGVISGNIVERLYRDVRALRIYEGTSEIQKLVIAKHLMKKETADGF